MLVKLKEDYKNTFVAFGRGKGVKPLGRREDLDELALLGLQAKDKTITRMFDDLPSIEDLQKSIFDAKLKSGMAALQPASDVLPKSDEGNNAPQKDAKSGSLVPHGSHGGNTSPE